MVRPKLDFILKSQQASGRFTSESDESLIRESDRELMMDAHLATRGIEDRRVLQAMAKFLAKSLSVSRTKNYRMGPTSAPPSAPAT